MLLKSIHFYFETEDLNRLIGNFGLNFMLIEEFADTLKEICKDLGFEVAIRGKIKKKPSGDEVED